MSITLDENDPFERALIDMVATHRAKGADYALDGDKWSNFRTTASIMDLELAEVADVFILTKYARLQALRNNGREPSNESVLDSRLDIAVYAIMAYAMACQDTPGVHETPVPFLKVVDDRPDNHVRICTCGCDEGQHMGKPKGCNRHGFHEFEYDHHEMRESQ